MSEPVTEPTEPVVEPTPEDEPVPQPDEPSEPSAPDESGEQGNQGGEEESPSEPPASPEPPAGLSQKEIDAKVSKCEKATENYINRVSAILGDDFSDFVLSPLHVPFLVGFIHNPELVPLDPDVVNATKALIGEPVPPPYLQDKGSQTCPDCDGWGMVLTGSKVHGKATANCKACGGRGATGDRWNVAPEALTPGYSVPVTDNGHEAEALLPEDPWGTPIGHPDYGKMPNFREHGWQQALEAYKRGEPAPIG